MALTPELIVPDLYNSAPQPTKTYSLDIETGKIGGKIDGLAAMQQFVVKAIRTARWRHVIYPDQYGSEIDMLIGQGFTDAYIRSELPRVITEALIYDERVLAVEDFKIDVGGDEVYTAFTVETVEGTLQISEVF